MNQSSGSQAEEHYKEDTFDPLPPQLPLLFRTLQFCITEHPSPNRPRITTWKEERQRGHRDGAGGRKGPETSGERQWWPLGATAGLADPCTKQRPTGSRVGMAAEREVRTGRRGRPKSLKHPRPGPPARGANSSNCPETRQRKGWEMPPAPGCLRAPAACEPGAWVQRRQAPKAECEALPRRPRSERPSAWSVAIRGGEAAGRGTGWPRGSRQAPPTSPPPCRLCPRKRAAEVEGQGREQQTNDRQVSLPGAGGAAQGNSEAPSSPCFTPAHKAWPRCRPGLAPPCATPRAPTPHLPFK